MLLQILSALASRPYSGARSRQPVNWGFAARKALCVRLMTADSSKKRKVSVLTSTGPTMAARTSSNMVDTADFADINKKMIEYDEMREKVIKESRDTQKLSKQAIFCLHRGDREGAATKLKNAQVAAEKLKDIVDKESTLRHCGSYSNSLEEFAEGKIFECFLNEGRVLRIGELPLVTRDEYLGGILDFTGELNRYAVARATERDTAAVKQCRDVIDVLMGVFLEFDFRNGPLRKKFDSLKYTLKKMETTLYEMSLTDNLGFHVAKEEGAPSETGAIVNGGEES